ncbi:hypothetical protein [Parendozoicomonas haliclonae]
MSIDTTMEVKVSARQGFACLNSSGTLTIWISDNLLIKEPV